MHAVDFCSPHALHNVAGTREIERAAQAALPAHTLMQRAGLAVAQLALAVEPHARRIWIACGPGNNGGDGLEAAIHLTHWAKSPVVTWLGNRDSATPDSAAAYHRACEAGVCFADGPPREHDLCIDALLGIGATTRVPEERMAHWIQCINTAGAPVLAVDVPSGLNADSGWAVSPHVRAHHTLSLLTLKPGLFTALGRDCVGTVWLDDLGVGQAHQPLSGPCAWLADAPASVPRAHASHKGSFGDVAIVGGAQGMTGAALLAARAALHAGAGRVLVGLLDGGGLNVDSHQPELMFRSAQHLDFSTLTTVCGCGGGETVATLLPAILHHAPALVIDADALNAIAKDAALQALLKARTQRQHTSVLTPHPLEAARLLGVSTAEIQLDRLKAAQALANRFDCIVILKGSGSVIAAPHKTPVINPTGNARLATAGTGDVLAGMVGAAMAAGADAWNAACRSVYQHGLAADLWPRGQTLLAGELARSGWVQ